MGIFGKKKFKIRDLEELIERIRKMFYDYRISYDTTSFTVTRDEGEVWNYFQDKITISFKQSKYGFAIYLLINDTPFIKQKVLKEKLSFVSKGVANEDVAKELYTILSENISKIEDECKKVAKEAYGMK